MLLLAGCATSKPPQSMVPPSSLDGIAGNQKAEADHDNPRRPRTIKEALRNRERQGDDVGDFLAAERKKWDALKEAARHRREAYLAAHPELSAADRNLIAAGRYRLGLTADAVRASIGEPQRLNRTVNGLGVFEQWVYRGGVEYLYFESGVLRSFQDSVGQ